MNWDRVFEVVLIAIVALAATVARVVHSIIHKKDYPPRDPELRELWDQRMRWAIAGEMAAVVLFVVVAEAIVVWRDLPGPVGVIMGAGAALLGYPFVAGIVRRRVAKRFEEA